MHLDELLFQFKSVVVPLNTDSSIRVLACWFIACLAEDTAKENRHDV